MAREAGLLIMPAVILTTVYKNNLIMKKHFYYIAIILLVVNSCRQKEKVEPNIFCMLSKSESGNSDSLGVEISSGYSFFGKEFWSYLCQKYPASTEIIFAENPIEIWGISKFGATTEKNIDTSKFYFSRTLDYRLRQNIDSILQKNSSQNNSVRKDYSRFKRLLSDTTFNIMSLYCDKATLQLIQSHKYGL